MLSLFYSTVSSAQTVDIQRGTTLFRQACIGCHDAGGNIIQPVGHPLMNDMHLFMSLQTKINLFFVPFSFPLF